MVGSGNGRAEDECKADLLQQAFAAAAADHSHGASEIERRLIDRLLRCEGAWRPQLLCRGAEQLRRHQTTMAGLLSLADRLERLEGDHLRLYLQRRLDLLDRLPEILAVMARPHLERCCRVVTLSRSSAVAGVLAASVAAGWDGRVVVLDGAVSGRGPEQARDLARVGVKVLSQPDATAARWLSGDPETVLLMVGADAVGSHRFINATGTGMLLELAAARSIKRLLVADSGKLLSEERLDEILAAGRWFEDGQDRSWPIFEAVPMMLISGWIREGFEPD